MNVSELRRGTSAAVIAGLLAVGVLACGTEQSPGAKVETPSASPSTAPADQQLTSPITYRRTGGFAGFNDTLVIQPDGSATLTDRQGSSFQCHVDKGALAQLSVATNAISSTSTPTGKPTPKTPMPDALYYSITIDGQTYSTRYDVKYDDSVSDVFGLLHRVFQSAADGQKGKKPSAKASALCAV
ncbi:hypothetical protein [Flindersiella endophytica]